MKPHRNPSLAALLEIGILFLPAIPAYLWMWPNLPDEFARLVQAIVYVYVLAGTVVIGRRRWSWSQLGLNRNGIGLTLACGLALLAARLMIILAIDWTVDSPELTWLRAVLDILYYFGLVSLTEELLFRGLVYRLLEDWKGVRWAIWGSSFGFMLWHIFSQGVLVGLATFLIGLLFALMRLRSGGIVGLIVLHGLWDLETAWLLSGSNAEILDMQHLSIANPTLLWLGTALLLAVPLYLLWGIPYIERW
jgi:membrane protease YdiL (CAAX protease family)